MGDAVYSTVFAPVTIIPISGVGYLEIDWLGDALGNFLLTGLVVSGAFFLLMAIGLWRRW